MKKHILKPYKTSVILLVILTSFTSSVYGQNITLQKQLEQSQYLSTVMKVDSNDAGMTRWLKKKVEKSKILPLAEDFDALKNTGPGTIQISKKIKRSTGGSILLETPASLAVKNPTNRSYASA